MAIVDFDGLAADAKTMADDPDAVLSLAALDGKAIATLKDVLANANSDDVKRKAAIDILTFNSKSGNTNKPTVTEEQLEYLGRIIVETEAVRLGVVGS